MDPWGYLSNRNNAVTPAVLNLIQQNETGHLSQADRWNPIKSRSPKGAVGGYQFMPNHLSDLGYKLPAYTINDALDPNKSRDMAGKFIKGYSDHYKFSNLAEILVGYNMGAKAASDWKTRGSNWDELPEETKQYLTRASSIIKKNPEKYNIPELTTDNNNNNVKQEGSPNMYPTTQNEYQNMLKAKHAENFITGRPYANQGSLFGRFLGMNTNEVAPDPYSEGRFLDEYAVPKEVIANKPILDNQHIVNGQNQQFEQVNTNPILSNNGYSPSGVLADQQVAVYGDYSSDINVPELDGVLAPQVVNNTSNGLLTSSAQASDLNKGYDYTNEGNYNGANQPILNSGYLSQPEAQTMKRRDRQDLTKGVKYPEDIGLSEMLIRIGGAGQANGHLGGNRQIADATGMYGNIMDYNRGQALAKYKTDATTAKANAKQIRADQDYLGNIDQSLGDMDKALAGLKSVDGNIFTGVTGLWDGTVGSFLDSMTGDPKATTRLLLQKLKVDDTLLRIAQTKGAISNKEMDLFMSPAPKVGFDNEEIWKTWINERKVALQRIKSRLTGNMQVVNSQQASQSQMINGIQVRKLTP